MVGAAGDTQVARVGFLASTARSGSTLTTRILGSLPGAFSVGELIWLFNYGLKLNRPCGCGQPFQECSFWNAVGDHAYGGWKHVDTVHAIDLRRRLTSNRRYPELLIHPTARTQQELDDFTGILAPLYQAVREVSGARVIIDNSKDAAVAMILRRVEGVDLSVVQLVRRSHGVAHSAQKHVARSDMNGKEMRRRSPARTAVRWTLDNALYEILGHTGTPSTIVRYEDLVAHPRETTRELAQFLGLDPLAVDTVFRGPQEVDLALEHSVWGNPMRLSSGPVSVRADDEWRNQLDAKSRRTVTALSWPALARYGYLRRA